VDYTVAPTMTGIIEGASLLSYNGTMVHDVNASVNENIKVFSRSPFFGHMSEGHLRKLASLATDCSFKKGDFVFRERDTSDFFYIVKQGLIKCFKQSASGKQLVAYMANASDSLNGIIIFSGYPHFLSALVIEDAVLLRIKREDYLSVIKKDNESLIEMIVTAGQLLSSAYHRLIDVVGERADQRIYNILYLLFKKFGTTLRFSGEEIGELAGTTTETATRVLMKLKQEKVIQSSRREIQVLDEMALEALSSCSDSYDGRI
jgi:CRP-like cAMP-binding protein